VSLAEVGDSVEVWQGLQCVYAGCGPVARLR
jgi:hypothetical protein